MAKVINWHNGNKIYDKDAVDELLSGKQDAMGPDALDEELSLESDKAVKNKAIAKALQDLDDSLRASIDELDTKTAAHDKLIEEDLALERSRAEAEEKRLEALIEDAADKSDAALFLEGVQVGETMLWPQYEDIERTVKSDHDFHFTVQGKEYETHPEDEKVCLRVSVSVPEGWHALDGSAELPCSEYPELAKFFRGTDNEDGSWNCDGNNTADDWKDGKSMNAKVWLPYAKQKIIKVK